MHVRQRRHRQRVGAARSHAADELHARLGATERRRRRAEQHVIEEGVAVVGGGWRAPELDGGQLRLQEASKGFVRQRRLERRAQLVIEARAERAVLGAIHTAAALPTRARHGALTVAAAEAYGGRLSVDRCRDGTVAEEGAEEVDAVRGVQAARPPRGV